MKPEFSHRLIQLAKNIDPTASSSPSQKKKQKTDAVKSAKDVTAKTEFPTCDDFARNSVEGLSLKMIKKLKGIGVHTLFPQVNNLSTVDMEIIAAKASPGQLSSKVRDHFFPSKQVIAGSPVREDDSGESTDLSDLDFESSELSFNCPQYQWAEQKVHLGVEDAAICDLIENRNLRLAELQAAYDAMESFEFEDKPLEDSCARSRSLMHAMNRSIVDLKSSIFAGSVEGPNDVKNELVYYSNMNSRENGLSTYMHKISHVPKAIVRIRYDVTSSWNSSASQILEEQLRNGSRVPERKAADRQGRGAKDFDLKESNNKLAKKRERQRKNTHKVNVVEALPAKVSRKINTASGWSSRAHDFAYTVDGIYSLQNPNYVDFKEIQHPIWVLAKERRRHLDPCDRCDLDDQTTILKHHHIREYKEKVELSMRINKKLELQGKPSDPLPRMPPFDINAINGDPPVISLCPPYPRRTFLRRLLRP